MSGLDLKRSFCQIAQLRYLPTLLGNQYLHLVCILFTFLAGTLRNLEDSGIYMDSVNPEYWIARTINPDLPNPAWIPPTVGPPALLTMYAGTISYFLELPMIKVLGFSTFSLRFAQSILGFVILVLVYKIVSWITRKPIYGFLTGLLLAIEPAFVFSYRTQFQVMLAGLVWLFLSLLLLYKNFGSENNRRINSKIKPTVIFSGIFFGLAIYTYFIYLFFLPALLIIVLTQFRRDIWKSINWIGGVILGLMPYVYGYLSMLIAVGSLKSTLELLKEWIVMLAPTNGIDDSVVSKLESALAFSYQAVFNIGNQWMLIGETLTPRSADLKWFVLALIVFSVGIVISVGKRKNSNTPEKHYIKVGLLLISSYLFFAGILGGRLRSHHFILLIPIIYVVVGISLFHLVETFGKSKTRGAATALCLSLVVALSFMQGNFTYERLQQTGGVGMSTNALSNLAIDARQSSKNVIYVFPQWGFFMPFAFQTQNLVEYSLDSSLINIERLASAGRQIRVAFWDREALESFKLSLAASSLNLLSDESTYYRSDGADAFYIIEVKTK